MRWTYAFDVDASVEQIYEAITPETWMTFYLPEMYRGVEHVDEAWPAEGSSIVLRYGLGPWSFRMRQDVTLHETGRTILLEERLLRGLWRDSNRIDMQPGETGTRIVVVSDQTSGVSLLRWLGPLRWLFNWIDLPPALKRFKALVEARALTPSISEISP
jgi:hypothetical protein